MLVIVLRLDIFSWQDLYKQYFLFSSILYIVCPNCATKYVKFVYLLFHCKGYYILANGYYNFRQIKMMQKQYPEPFRPLP